MNVIKFLIKIIVILIIFQCIFVPTKVEALSFSEIFSKGNEFIENGKNSITVKSKDGTEEETLNIGIDDDELTRQASDIYFTLFNIGVIIAVIVGGILGISFMLASVEEKAKIKEALIPYILGCVVVFGAFGIWKFVVGILNNL